ncbi:MAG: hypothetical protein IJ776_06505 [Paludibacteraceae bacterium]|nr:hypothetical protein [Paludibacteraceae bacterium]
MKTKIYLLLVSVSILTFVSCGNSNPPSTGGDEMPAEQLVLIKMTPELQEHVFVSPIVDSVIITDINSYYCYKLFYGDGLVLCNPTKADSIYSDFIQSQFQLLGTSPYILLEDGYAIIDWKWRHFHPLFGAFRGIVGLEAHLWEYRYDYKTAYTTNAYYANGALENEEYYLLPIHWNEITDLKHIWGIEEGRKIEKPEIHYINCTKIEEFGDFTTSIRNIRIKNRFVIYDSVMAEYSLYSQDKEMYNNCVKEIDQLQSMYVETLNQMIKNKYFDK